MPTFDLAARVAAGTTYRARAYPATTVPAPFERHLMNRMGCGYSRSTWQDLRSAGGGQQWFSRQLDPASVTESPLAESILSWFPHVDDSPTTRWANGQANTYEAWEYARDLGNYTALRRMFSPGRSSRRWSTSGTTTCTCP
jgi:hypothetical protein